MKLKKEVKVVLLHIAIITATILTIVIISNMDKKAYDNCMVGSNNDAELCKNLLR